MLYTMYVALSRLIFVKGFGLVDGYMRSEKIYPNFLSVLIFCDLSNQGKDYGYYAD